MVGFVRGDVVISYFPYSDLSQAKKRPALVVAQSTGVDIVLCEITSKPAPDRYGVTIDERNFQRGRLSQTSYVRANRFFTADSLLVDYVVGKLRPDTLDAVLMKIAQLYGFNLQP